MTRDEEARLASLSRFPEPPQSGRMINATLRAMAAHVENNATNTALDLHQRLSDEQRLAKGEKIKAVARELQVLADASKTRKVAYREYETLKDRLYVFGFSLPPTLLQDVAASFREAEGPVTPRGLGWLKGQGGA